MVRNISKILFVGLMLNCISPIDISEAKSKVQLYKNDARYMSTDSSSLQGYTAGQIDWTGGYVQSIQDNTHTTTSMIQSESRMTRYYKAKNAALVNQVVTRKNGKVIRTKANVNYQTQANFNNRIYFNERLFNHEFLKLMNTERKKYDLSEIKYGRYLKRGTERRSSELSRHGDLYVNGQLHRRLDGRRFETAFEYLKTHPRYMGENLAMIHYTGNIYQFYSEKYLAELFYDRWKASPPHYQLMMGHFKTAFVSVKVAESSDYSGSTPLATFTGTTIFDGLGYR